MARQSLTKHCVSYQAAGSISLAQAAMASRSGYRAAETLGY